jgi:TPR repeat protein
MVKKTGEMMKYFCLVAFLFLLWLIAHSTSVDACGWWGDGESDDSDDAIEVVSEKKPIPDAESSIDDPQIQTRLGNNYKTGMGVDKNYKKAVYWYRKAAEQDFAPAQNNLAVMYEQGLGLPKDESEAVKWYRRAAEQHDAKAQHSIGIMYRDGRGIPRDQEEAVKWIGYAAEQGHPRAFRDMGDLYWSGSGVPRNDILAYMWWKLGAEHGDKESGGLLTMAASKMDAESIAEAEKLSREWVEKNK